MRSFFRKSMISIFKIHSQIAEATEKDQKKKLSKLMDQVDKNMKYFTSLYNKIISNAQKIFKAGSSTVKRVLKEASELHESQNTDKEKPNDHASKCYIEFQKQLFEIIYVSNKFLDYIHISMSSLASEKEHKMTKYLNNLCRKSIDLLHDLGDFCHADAEVEKTNLSVEASHCQTRDELTDFLMKFMIWSLSKIAHSFIKIKQPLNKTDEHDVNQNLLKSKILSGGIENRFLNTFSKETCHTIENLATITGDSTLVEYLTKTESLDEDEIYQAIIHQGKDENVDRLIDLLQWNLLRKNPAAKAGGAEGMTVSRCAFAANLALNQHDETCSYTNFVMMVDQLEMSLDMVDEGATENQRNKELMEEIQSLGSVQGILDRWAKANAMRIWLQDKRKDISNSIKKKADAEHRRKEEEERLLKESELKNSEDIEKDTKESHDEETIDTTSKSRIEPIPQEEILRREQEQLKVLIGKVIEKAELLVKLATPPSWDQPDSSTNTLRNIDGYNEEGDIKEENLKTKLQRIRSIQASTGTITSYENLSNKDIFNSCTSSVLATLQCSVSAKSIMKAIEEKYISAMNRYCGLKIMGELASCFMNDQTKISCFNWFCSALRHNSNILAHYSDDLVGMGEYLLDKCRTSFFEVYNGIILQLKDTTDLNTIEFLLNCTKWKIGATDHQYILKSGIIQTLKEGNGHKDRAKNPIKYSWGHLINYSTDSEMETLSHMILETLEFIMMSCFSRILDEGEDKSLNIKKGGSSIAKIQQASSTINTNITEVLLASSFEIIFEQLHRYTEMIQNMDPIDWQLFVEKRNEMRRNNQNIDYDEESPLQDEKTPEEIQKEEEEEQKLIDQRDEELKAQSEEDSNYLTQKFNDVVNRRKEKEIKKLKSIYDDKVILKLLRLLEVFTSIALKNSDIHRFVLQVTRPSQIISLINLLLN